MKFNIAMDKIRLAIMHFGTELCAETIAKDMLQDQHYLYDLADDVENGYYKSRAVEQIVKDEMEKRILESKFY